MRNWHVIDNMHTGDHSNGLELEWADGAKAKKFFFVVLEVRLLQHALEFFWNKIQTAAGQRAKAKSTHGRTVVKISTLLGEAPPPPSPDGDLVITDKDGKGVKAGGAKRRSSIMGAAKDVPVNGDVARHWPEVCRHQGWLLKKGGLAKSWMKRYAVLYCTCQGHFLCYYSEYVDCPLYCKEQKERNVIDLCKTTFIRPVASGKDAPQNSFDICTIEREWTLSADSKDSMQRWLQVITRTIDEDVPIVPDDELVFMVKPRTDPTQQLIKNEYSTVMKVSASGVAVCSTAGAEGEEAEKFFWCYTDFFKWSVLYHNGKQALSVSVFTSGDFDSKARQEFLFRTREAQKLATAIEYGGAALAARVADDAEAPSPQVLHREVHEHHEPAARGRARRRGRRGRGRRRHRARARDRRGVRAGAQREGPARRVRRRRRGPAVGDQAARLGRLAQHARQGPERRPAQPVARLGRRAAAAARALRRVRRLAAAGREPVRRC